MQLIVPPAVAAVIQPTGDPPRRVFRYGVPLTLQSEGADGLAVARADTRLSGAFRPYEYDARPAGPLAARIEFAKDAVPPALIATLDAPREVRRVRHRSEDVDATSATGRLLRVDGTRLAEPPTARANDMGLFPDPPNDFTDHRFAVRFETGAPPLELKGAEDLAELRVRSLPSGPRLGVAPASDPGAAVFFWQLAGEVGRTLPAAAGAVQDAGEALATALQRFVDGLASAEVDHRERGGPLADAAAPLLGQTVEAALVVESDAPCVFELEQLDVGYRLVGGSFARLAENDQASILPEKAILRFPGGEPTRREAWLGLPARATVSAATLTTFEVMSEPPQAGPGGAGAGAGGGGAVPTAPGARGPLSERQGMHVDRRRWVGARLAPERPSAAIAVALGMVPLAGDTELVVEVQGDWRGEPSGETLFETTLLLEEAGEPTWASAALPDVVLLPSRPRWLVVTAASGQAIWLASAVGAGANDAVPVRVLSRPNRSVRWTVEAALGGLLPALRLEAAPAAGARATTERVADGGPEPGDSGTGSVGGAIAPAATIELAVAGLAVTLPPASASGTRTVELAPALNQALAEAGQESPAAVPLAFRTGRGGSITVYPPRVEYDLPG